MPAIEGVHTQQRRHLSKGACILMFVLALLVVLTAAVVMLLLAWSPGKMRPLLDKDGSQIPGSISEKVFANINGVTQGMILKSTNPKNPILLIVHGGLGMPEYFLNVKYPVGLEHHFTVCWWERRGAGLSYSPKISGSEVTIEQLVSDTIAVTDYLLDRFGQTKIYLMGHSGGSFIGIQAAARAPEKYKAYIGIAQMSHQIESEKLAYSYMLERYAEAGKTKRAKKLQRFPILSSDARTQLAYFPSIVRDNSMHELGIGTMHNMKSIIAGVLLPVMQCREYTLREKMNVWRGKAFLQKSTDLAEKMLMTNLADRVRRLDIPVYFLSGVHDYTVAYSLSRQYLERIEAPEKGFYTFLNSAHSPLFEEPDVFMHIMTRDVMEGRTDLAD